jgi:adenylate cyclase
MMNLSELQKIADWLIDGARSAVNPSHMMTETCERLVRAGLPLWRVGVFVQTLHPGIFGVSFIWRPGAEVVTNTAESDPRITPEFKRSPLAALYEKGQEVRYRLDDPETRRFPFFDDMRAEGVTDYIALDTYVGNRAGERILGGQIRRGHTDTMQAAIWLSDLRGFTALSDRLPAETVVDILNQYFDCQVHAIKAHGGEVLKFMGDGLLAVFPIAEAIGDAEEVCGHVLEAARESRASVDAMHYPIGETIERFRFGVALHVGKILFGNIGGGNRLDFTCIGPAVNLAARLEKIAGRLHRTIVASAGFARICQSQWADLGEFPISGFSKAERVYGLSDETPAG